MRWTLPPPATDAATRAAQRISLPVALVSLLAQRGIKTDGELREFLHPALEQLHPPSAMLGMEVAVTRLERAIAAREKILIYGDYDVDGTIAVVILKTCIELLGGQAGFHVPHRIREGYGMQESVIEEAAKNGVTLVISVDTGIRAFTAAEAARRAGVDMIVTDHHLADSSEGLPTALAVLNPNQPGCGYPCKALCGAGVAFKFVQAMLERSGQQRLLPSFLKMVAIATVADAVPLTGENRVITRLGLEGLRRPVQGGLKALMQVAQLENSKSPITTTDISFRLAPRINAAGRMDVAQDVIELFTTADGPRQRALAAKLNELNSRRQAEEARILVEINARLDNDASLRDAYLQLIDGDGWHRGVIGIAATRVVERTGRPAVVVSRDEHGEAHGSGRSIPAFHLLDALESPGCRPLFSRFGGHAFAVGFALPSERLPELRAALDAYARTRLVPEDFVPELKIDAEIGLDDITPEFGRCLESLEPYGVGNREPVFAVRGLKILSAPRILKEKHVKLRIEGQGVGGKRSISMDALGWRLAERAQQEHLAAGDRLDLAFTVEENRHPDFGGLQLVIRDWKKTTA